MAHSRCGNPALMISSLRIVRDTIMARFGWAVEDVVC